MELEDAEYANAAGLAAQIETGIEEEKEKTKLLEKDVLNEMEKAGLMQPCVNPSSVLKEEKGICRGEERKAVEKW